MFPFFQDLEYLCSKLKKNEIRQISYLLQMCVFVLIFLLQKRREYSNRLKSWVPSLFKQNLIETLL